VAVQPVASRVVLSSIELVTNSFMFSSFLIFVTLSLDYLFEFPSLPYSSPSLLLTLRFFSYFTLPLVSFVAFLHLPAFVIFVFLCCFPCIVASFLSFRSLSFLSLFRFSAGDSKIFSPFHSIRCGTAMTKLALKVQNSVTLTQEDGLSSTLYTNSVTEAWFHLFWLLLSDKQSCSGN
jgi:hypothetical protein